MTVRLSLALAVAVCVLASSASGATTSAHWFVTPGKNVSCELGFHRPAPAGTYVWCLAYHGGKPYKTARAVQMNSAAKLTVCHGLRCIGNSPVGTPTLPVGHSIDLGPFRCTALHPGVRCIVRNSGHGFRLTVHRITPI